VENFDEGIKHEFLTEAREMLEEVESKFLDLERDPTHRPTMDHIFRLAHTVKGSSFAAGFMELGAFAHTFETLLNLLREGKAEATPHVVDLLLRSNDTLQKFINALTDNFDAQIDVRKISELLLECIGTDVKEKWDGPSFGFFDDDEPAAPPAPVVAATINVATPVVAVKKSVPVAKPTPAVSSAPSKIKLEPPIPSSGVHLSSSMSPVVLICDDEPDIIEIAAEMLKLRYPDLTIFTAADGLEAIEQVKKCKPHVIVTDLRMPNLNGIEFVTAVRIHDENVPVIFFSGYADRDNMIEFMVPLNN
jgi:chemotaxis protein histidine kinase CheA